MTKKAHSKARVQVGDFAKLQLPRAISLSSDGRSLAYTLSRCDLEKKKYFSNIHVLDTKIGISRQWTFGDQGDRSPEWSKDGTRLAFLRHEKGEDRIYILSCEGGEAELIFKQRGSFAQIKWAENDSSLIVKFRKADPDPEAEKAIAEGKEPQGKVPASRRITRLTYRMDGQGFLPEDRFHLYRLDLRSKAFEQLTKGNEDDGCFDVSPDGETVAFVANVSDDPDLHPFHLQIYLLNLKTRKRHLLSPPLGDKYALAFSPNGKYLVYLGHHNIHDPWGVEQIHPWLIDLKTEKLKNLTPGYDRQPQDLVMNDLGFGGATPLAWSKDSKRVYYLVTSEGNTYIAAAKLTQGDPELVWEVPGEVADFTMADDAVAVLHLDWNSPGDLYYSEDINSTREAYHQLTNFNHEYLAEVELGKVREVRFKSVDGTRLQGWMIVPPDFNPRKKYPAILEVHGGPRVQYGRAFFHEMYYLAAQGFVVFFTNPRGSQGYGKAFSAATVANWGLCDFNDIMAAADCLEEQPFVDKKRIGITGGSYGGYMTVFSVGHTRRFRAAVTQRGVIDLASAVGTSDIGFAFSYELGGYPWENQAGYEKMSPYTYADKIRTPLLIIHNEGDLRCSIEQAEKLFAFLKIHGRTTEFLRIPEEPHGLSRGGRPDRRIIRLEAIAGWFKKYMK